jgi:AraC-like DNA-binding protein
MNIKNHSSSPRPIADMPRLLLDQAFSDMGDYGSGVGWDLEFRQLDRGPLNARASVIASARMASIRVEFNRRFHQQGMAPEGVWTFGLPDVNCREFQWCGAEAVGGDLLNFNHESGFDGTSHAGFSGVTVSFQVAHLRRLIGVMGLEEDLLDQSRKTSVWRGPPAKLRWLRSQFRAAYHLANMHPRSDLSRASDLFDSRAAEVILGILAERCRLPEISRFPDRSNAVSRALELINDQERLPLKVSDLCEYAGVSAPTLYRGFMERFGVSPKKYVQCRMLTSVREELRMSGPSVKIHQIANRWGFWHMGQFAADYRQQFGELPKNTLFQ